MMHDLLYRLRSLLRRKGVEQELEDELRFHLEHETDKLVRRGLNHDEASRRARLALWGLEQAKEQARDARGVRSMEETVQDIRYALRSLRRTPAFTMVGRAYDCTRTGRQYCCLPVGLRNAA
jgi:putative ABC transport system permease protein